MKRGDTPIWDVAVTNPDGTPFDLTGYVAYFTAKRLITDADPGVFQLSVGAGITVTSAIGGLLAIQPPRTATNTLTEDVRLFVDVQISETAGALQTFTVWPSDDDWPGELVIVRDVTRAP
jgi:hypothetical protein